MDQTGARKVLSLKVKREIIEKHEEGLNNRDIGRLFDLPQSTVSSIIKKKRKAVSLKTKLEIIKKHEEGWKNRDIRRFFDLPHSTLCSIIKKKDIWKEKVQQFGINLKKTRRALHVDLETAMIQFCQEATSNNVTLTGPIIQKKAIEIAKSLNIENFKSSNGWVSKFKLRHGILGRSMNDSEQMSLLTVDVDPLRSETLTDVIHLYDSRDIFSISEADIFYQCDTIKSKLATEKLRVFVGANCDGSEKLDLLVIGQSMKPFCSNTLKSLPIVYKISGGAKMMSCIFEEYLSNLDDQFEEEKRAVLFIVDSSLISLQTQEKLNHIRLEVFSESQTFTVQPIDSGVIQSLKENYTARLEATKNQKSASSMNILTAIHILSETWVNDIKSTVIINSFQTAGFVVSNNDVYMRQESDSIFENGEDNYQESSYNNDTQAIKTEFSEESEDNKQNISKPSKEALLKAFEIIKKAMLATPDTSVDMFSSVEEIQEFLLDEYE